uniref:Uncharacterized protein n=1 Tax=Rhizophora mucronata TaxID=61149 RepID=A0A2P2P3A7_RHIMU
MKISTKWLLLKLVGGISVENLKSKGFHFYMIKIVDFGILICNIWNRSEKYIFQCLCAGLWLGNIFRIQEDGDAWDL